MFSSCTICGGPGSKRRLLSIDVTKPTATCPACIDGFAVPEETIESVAEALYVADNGFEGIWNNVGGKLRNAYRSLARAAISALIKQWFEVKPNYEAARKKLEHRMSLPGGVTPKGDIKDIVDAAYE